MAAVAQEVLGYLREHRQVLVGFLERLALAESPSTEPGAQNEVLDILSEALIEIGYACGAYQGAGAAAISTRDPKVDARPRNSCSDTAILCGRWEHSMRFRSRSGTMLSRALASTT